MTILSVFEITAEKILTLMGFFVVGYILARKKILPENAPQTLSKLLTLLFCPALTLNNLAENLNRGSIREHGKLMLISSCVIVVSILLMRPLSRLFSRGDEDLRGILDYNLIFSNYGYIGYPMVQGVFGAAVLSRFLLFATPLSVVCYTYGRMVVEGRRKISLRFLLTPLSLSLWIGILIGVLEIPLPPLVSGFLSASGNCMGPVSMLITGMILSRVKLAACMLNVRNYLFAALRLVILPLSAVAVLYLLGVRGEALFFTGCFMCLPFGNNPIVFREAMGMDAQKAAGMTLISYFFSLLTVPAIFALLQSLSGMA